MADKNRYINTKFWNDNYISNLDPIEKLMYLYVLTNPMTNLLGIYEIPLKRIAFDTGIDKEMIEKIFQRFEKDNKMIYLDGWLVITHFTKHQKFNPSTKAAVEEIIIRIPDSVLQALDRLSAACSYINLNSNINFNINNNLLFKNLNTNYNPTEKVKWIKPVFEEFEKYIKDNKLNLNAKELYKYYEVGKWHDGKGNKVKNWKQKLLVLNKYQNNKQPDKFDNNSIQIGEEK